MLLMVHLTSHDAIVLGLPYALLFLTVGGFVGTLLARRLRGRTLEDPPARIEGEGVYDDGDDRGA
ncbi:MAG: hypothetical protein ACC682_05940 [Gemmatimonadota bacterium]